MLLTVFLAIVFCGAITLMLISAVAFVQDNRFFSSAPKEAREVLKAREVMDMEAFSRAVDALIAMLNGAREAGFYPRVYVGYRSYINQASQYQSQVNKFVNDGYSRLDAEKAAAEISAAPGTSEHQTGLGADLVDRYTESLSGFTLDPNFEAWLNEHCVEYGFIMRYPENKISITGRYEPWHVRYVGQIAANFMKVHDLCLEEFVMLY